MNETVFTFGGDAPHSNARQKDKTVAGGKGANLAEMASIGLPVPPGFTIATEECLKYLAGGADFTEKLRSDVAAALNHVEKTVGKDFGDAADPLLVSVRSGAAISMPGMMDTVLNLGLNDETVQGLADTSGDARFAWDSYRRFIQMYGDVVLGVDHGLFEEALELDPAFELVEAAQRVVDAFIGHQAAQLDAILGAFEARGDRGLAAARFAQAVLQLLDVLLVSPQRIVEYGDFLLELVAHVGRFLLLDERRTGEVLAVLGDGELCLLVPVRLELVELDRMTMHFLLVGDGARGTGADLDQRFLHFEDDHADHLLGVVRLVEHVVEIGGDDIAGTAENAH